MPSRRTLEWFSTIAHAQNVTSGGQANVSLLSLMDVSVVKGSTITRIILQFILQAQTAATLGRLNYGIVLVSQDAAAAGAFPDADITADQADWLVRGQETVLASDANDGSQLVRVYRDLRAQRVIRSADDELHFIIDQNASGMNTVFDLFTRVLVRLP